MSQRDPALPAGRGLDVVAKRKVQVEPNSYMAMLERHARSLLWRAICVLAFGLLVVVCSVWLLDREPTLLALGSALVAASVLLFFVELRSLTLQQKRERRYGEDVFRRVFDTYTDDQVAEEIVQQVLANSFLYRKNRVHLSLVEHADQGWLVGTADMTLTVENMSHRTQTFELRVFVCGSREKVPITKHQGVRFDTSLQSVVVKLGRTNPAPIWTIETRGAERYLVNGKEMQPETEDGRTKIRLPTPEGWEHGGTELALVVEERRTSRLLVLPIPVQEQGRIEIHTRTVQSYLIQDDADQHVRHPTREMEYTVEAPDWLDVTIDAAHFHDRNKDRFWTGAIQHPSLPIRTFAALRGGMLPLQGMYVSWAPTDPSRYPASVSMLRESQAQSAGGDRSMTSGEEMD